VNFLRIHAPALDPTSSTARICNFKNSTADGISGTTVEARQFNSSSKSNGGATESTTQC
jgi:hypothetical protein